ncbi:MAG: hypothetical protein Q4A72_01660 [Bacillota bacterium]|nr:hypothetical protein [Bacillota bacterium]
MKNKNVSRRIASVLFAFVMLLGLFDNVHAARLGAGKFSALHNEEESFPQDPSHTAKNEPKLELKHGSNLGTFLVSKEQKIAFTLKNISTDSAYDMKVELNVNQKDEKLFVSKNFRAEEKVLAPTKEKSFSLPFEMKSATPEGTYNMTLKITYKNAYKNQFVKEFPVYMYVQNGNVKPVVEIAGTEFQNGWISSDGPSKMRINLKNNGTLDAKNIEIKLDGLDPKGVFLVKDSAFRKLSTLQGNVSQLFGFELQANPNVDKDQEITAIITYYDAVDNKYESTHKILVPCSANSGQGAFADVDMNFSKAQYSVVGDGKTTVTLTLKNKGEKDLKNLKLELSSTANITFMSNYLNLIDVLKAGETKTFNYTVVSANAESEGNNPITAKLMSASAAAEDTSRTKIQVAGITSYKKDGAGAGKKPKIIIADYAISGEKVVAGKEFILTVMVRNTSQSIGIKNIKITHNSQDGVFIPIDAANSFFIDYIHPGGVVERKIKLTSKPDAAAKMYKIDFKGEYEDESGKSYDEKGNPFVSEESINLNLTQEIRLEIPELSIQESAMVGEGIPIDVEFYNMGKAPLYNMLVKLEGDFDTDVRNYFVGKFDTSRSDTFSAKITPTAEGDLKGKLIFEYEDETGVKDRKEKEFTIFVSGVMEEDLSKRDDMMMGEDGEIKLDENGNPIEDSGMSFLTMIIIAAVVIVAVIVFVVVNKKRKKKKLEKMLLESDDEDK